MERRDVSGALAIFVALIAIGFFSAAGLWVYKAKSCKDFVPEDAKSGNTSASAAKQQAERKAPTAFSEAVRDHVQAERERNDPEDRFLCKAQAGDFVTGFVGFTAVMLGLLQIFIVWETLLITRDSVASLRRAERAYLFVSVRPNVPAEKQSDMLLGGKAGVAALFGNRGKTPAILKVVKSAVFHSDQTPQALPEGTVHRELPTAWAVRPDGDFNYPRRVELTGNVPEEVRTGKTTLYYAGVVEYEDIFGVRWETGFCWHYIPDRHLFKPTNGTSLNYQK